MTGQLLVVEGGLFCIRIGQSSRGSIDHAKLRLAAGTYA